MTDLELEPVIAKLISYGKDKKILSWEEINEILPNEVVINSDLMDKVLAQLQQNNILFQEEEDPLLEDEEPEVEVEEPETELDEEESEEEEGEDENPKQDESDRKRLVYSEKDSSVDDPIRLYLREIGKESLLNAEQEVALSQKMENGENIIRDVIKYSGMIIPEFYAIAQKAFSRIDIHENSRPRKEINEEMAEKRRLKNAYSEYLRPVLSELKQYMHLKKQLYDRDQNRDMFEDPQLVQLRDKLLTVFQKAEIQSEEIERFSDRFVEATNKISDYRHRQEKKEKELRIA
ncbi:MAG: RNA polymerase sigma factor RpoD, partial [Spirochaetaceae bacterium]|nr:RNA polymerase sigma factor RpoD [Spirochaetaceae bacterium]